MDRLILLRHGKAEPGSVDGEDISRRLADRGRVDAGETGRRLAELGLAPDLALVSVAERTRETWDALKHHFPEAEARFEDDLYHAEAEVILQLAEEAGESQPCVMVVGHNPGLHELAVQLLGRAAAAGQAGDAPILRDFPTAAAAAFRFGEDGRPAFEALILPRRGA